MRGSREFWLGNYRKNPEFLASFAGERQITNDAAFWLPLVKPEHFTWLDDESNILDNYVFEQIPRHFLKIQITDTGIFFPFKSGNFLPEIPMGIFEIPMGILRKAKL